MTLVYRLWTGVVQLILHQRIVVHSGMSLRDLWIITELGPSIREVYYMYYPDNSTTSHEDVSFLIRVLYPL